MSSSIGFTKFCTGEGEPCLWLNLPDGTEVALNDTEDESCRPVGMLGVFREPVGTVGKFRKLFRMVGSSILVSFGGDPSRVDRVDRAESRTFPDISFTDTGGFELLLTDSFSGKRFAA